MKTLNTILFLIFFNVGLVHANSTKPHRHPQNNEMLMYQVQPGDHLAEILRSMGLEPLWGPNGYVQRTIEINKLKTPNQLTRGTWLKIPVDQPANIENYEMDHGVARKKPTTVEVYCPNGSVQAARVYMIPSRGPGRPAKVVFLDSQKSVCSEAAAVPVPVPTAAEVSPELPTQDPTAIDDLDIQMKPAAKATPEVQPTPAPEPAPQLAPPPAEEALKKEEAIKAVVGENKGEVDDYFSEDRTGWGGQVAPEFDAFGYGSNRFQVDANHFTMNKGFNYGARLEGSWGSFKHRLLFGGDYLMASLTNSGVSSDKANVTMTSYGVGYRYKSWSFRAGMINNSIKSTVGTNSLSFKGSGTFFSIAHNWKINMHWSFLYTIRSVNASYSASSNSDLQNDLKGTQLESILGFEYRWGMTK